MHVIFVIMLIFFCTLNLFVRLFVKFILWSSSVNLTLYLHLEVLQVFLRRHREDFSICVQKQKLTNNLHDYFVYVTRRYYRWIVTRPNQSWFIWLCIHINYMQFLKFCFKLTCKKKVSCYQMTFENTCTSPTICKREMDAWSIQTIFNTYAYYFC